MVVLKACLSAMMLHRATSCLFLLKLEQCFKVDLEKFVIHFIASSSFSKLILIHCQFNMSSHKDLQDPGSSALPFKEFLMRPGIRWNLKHMVFFCALHWWLCYCCKCRSRGVLTLCASHWFFTESKPPLYREGGFLWLIDWAFPNATLRAARAYANPWVIALLVKLS